MQIVGGVRTLIFICARCIETQRASGVLKSSTSSALFQAFRIQSPVRLASRFIHNTPVLSKKKDRPLKHEATPEKDGVGSSTNMDDPFDYSELESSIFKAHAKLKQDLSKIRGGGNSNHEAVENLRVRLDKTANETTRLGDVAQCVPRGRILTIVAGDKGHIKAITSAIQSSDLSLTPQTDAQNPLQLHLSLPNPTAESRRRAVQDALKLGEAASIAVKNARGTQQKRLRAMQLSRSARPDDLKRASDKMEKIVTDASSKVKHILDNAKKILESA